MPNTANSLSDSNFPGEIQVDQIDNLDIRPHPSIVHHDDAKRKLEAFWGKKALNIRPRNLGDD